MWQGRDPLPHGHVGEDVVHEVGGALSHPSAAATGTEATPLARERHQPLASTRVAPEPGEAAGQEAAAQERCELGVNEPRQPLAVAQPRGLDEKGLDVLPHDGVEDGRGRVARRVGQS